MHAIDLLGWNLVENLIPESGSQLCGNVPKCERSKFFSHQANCSEASLLQTSELLQTPL